VNKKTRKRLDTKNNSINIAQTLDTIGSNNQVSPLKTFFPQFLQWILTKNKQTTRQEHISYGFTLLE
jgi:hypothetical protein